MIWIQKTETFLNVAISYLPVTGALSSRFSTVLWKSIPRLQTTGGLIIRKDISVLLFYAQIAIWRTSVSLELWASAMPGFSIRLGKLSGICRNWQQTHVAVHFWGGILGKFFSDAVTKDRRKHHTAFSDGLKVFPLSGSRACCQNTF